MFKHALTHEVAYSSLLMNRRRELHRMIGLAIEELYADRLGEQYEVLAHHFSKAEEWPKAFDYLLKAADKAGKAFSIRDALALYDQALKVAGRLQGEVPLSILMTVHQAKSNHYFALGEFANSRAEAENFLAVARRAEDHVSEATALAWIGFATQWAQDFEGALTYAQRAIHVAEQAGAQPALARAHLTVGYVHALSGRLEEAQGKLDQAITISQSAGDAALESLALQLAGMVKSWQGIYADASQLSAKGLLIARERNLLMPLLRGFWAHALVLGSKGEYDEALALLEEGLALTEKVGDEALIPRYLNTIGWIHSECEDLDHAFEVSSVAAERARNWRHAVGVEMAAYAEINRGDVLMAKGDLVLAREVLDAVHHIVKNPSTHDWMKWRYSTHLFVSLGEFWLAHGDPEKAWAFVNQCLEIARRTNSQRYLVWGYRLRGGIALARRQWDEAEESLRQALGIAQAIGNPRQLWKTHFAAGQLYDAMKKPAMARHAYGAARQVIAGVRESLRDPRLRAGFEQAPAIRELYGVSRDQA